MDALGRILTAIFDAAGNQTQRHDPRNYVTTYDTRNRLTARLYADGSLHTFVYDEVGNRTKMQDQTGLYTMTYDAANRRDTLASPGGQLTTFSRDAIGNRTLRVP